MTSLENRSNLIAVVAGIVLALAVLYLLMAPRAWLRQCLPLYPVRPPPGDLSENAPRAAGPSTLMAMQTILYRNAL